MSFAAPGRARLEGPSWQQREAYAGQSGAMESRFENTKAVKDITLSSQQLMPQPTRSSMRRAAGEGGIRVAGGVGRRAPGI